MTSFRRCCWSCWCYLHKENKHAYCIVGGVFCCFFVCFITYWDLLHQVLVSGINSVCEFFLYPNVFTGLLYYYFLFVCRYLYKIYIEAPKVLKCIVDMETKRKGEPTAARPHASLWRLFFFELSVVSLNVTSACSPAQPWRRVENVPGLIYCRAENGYASLYIEGVVNKYYGCSYPPFL